MSAGGSVAECGLQALRTAILRRDPLGIGFDDYWGLDLISRLLRWNPKERIDLRQAFKHAYFTGSYVSDIDGSEHG
jgi:serine/threonine protein kinase